MHFALDRGAAAAHRGEIAIALRHYGCPIHAARHAWLVAVDLSRSLTRHPAARTRLALSPVSAGGARQEKVRFLTQSFSTTT
jgi:hypothetical protein